MDQLKKKKGFICDMDGVLYHGNQLLPGVERFVNWLTEEKKNYLFLTNSSQYTPKELQQKLARMGLDVDESHFYTSALATAYFLDSQAPGCSAYVVGEHGIMNALYDKGITYNDVNPDYVVVGESSAYNLEQITKAIRLVNGGAKLIGTNPDLTAPVESGIVPACRAHCPHRAVYRKERLLCGKAQPPYDADRPAHAGRPLRECGHGGGPHGYGHYRGHRDRAGHCAGAVRRVYPGDL